MLISTTYFIFENKQTFSKYPFFSEYLKHAGCLKEKSVHPDYCGDYYTTLMEMVRGETDSTHTQICWWVFLSFFKHGFSIGGCVCPLYCSLFGASYI